MKLEISEADLTGFNDQARRKLQEATHAHCLDLIEESNRIEAAHNTNKEGKPEVTSSMVSDASGYLRRGLTQTKTKMWPRVLRVVAAVLFLLVGVLYDSTELVDSAYMAFFIFVVASAILAVTVSAIQE